MISYSHIPPPLPILAIAKATPGDYVALTNIWERSVRATHSFLSDESILDIRNDVYDIYLHKVDVHVASLVWNTAEALPEQALAYTLPQKLMKALAKSTAMDAMKDTMKDAMPDIIPNALTGAEKQGFDESFATMQKIGQRQKSDHGGKSAQEQRRERGAPDQSTTQGILQDIPQNTLVTPPHTVPQTIPLGFIGILNNHIEMLFIDEPYHRLGLGKILLKHAVRLGATSVDVNEQNPGAYQFYTKMGFRQCGRSPLDAQGNPFPLLHLQLPLQMSASCK